MIGDKQFSQWWFFALLLVLVLHGTCVQAVEKNGFNLDGSSIPVEEIFRGGPPRDGIPSIDNPVFTSPTTADALDDNARVLGIDYRGVQRAYPISILNWHEVVNDNIKGDALAVTFCPLCGTGMVFKSDIAGQKLQFGVSGLLYNSDVLLYDRQTESLWSQILSQGVSGKFNGQVLESVAVAHTSWKAWRQRHPDTTLLSPETGFSRDYRRTPYAGYDKSKAIFFPVTVESRRYHPKERVLGVRFGDRYKAYPIVELAKHGAIAIKDRFAGEDLTIQLDAENQDATVLNAAQQQVPVVNGFWFAWYAFHPDTEIYEAP